MKRILYFDWHSAATEFYRMMPLDYISHHDITITRSTEHNVTFATISAYDVIVISRPSSVASVSLIRLAKDMGKKAIGDYDDGVLSLPNDMHPMYWLYENEKASIIECLLLLDEIWVSTPAIKNSFRLYNKNVHVIPNCLDDYLFKLEDKKQFTYNKVALWRGGQSHIADMYQRGTAEWLIKLVNSEPKWKFYFIGQRFEWLECRAVKGNYYRHEGATTIQFYKLMQIYNASVFYYPLVHNLFNIAKSNCSFIEATYSGSAFFGNNDLPEFDIEPIAKLGDMKKAFKDPVLLSEMNNKGWEYVKDKLLLSDINKIRKERLLEI